MSKRDRRDSDRRDYDRRDSQPDDEQQRRAGEGDLQESDSLAALKAILSKVSSLLKPMQLTSEEAIKLVEQLYGSVLDMDMKLAGEADDTRKASVLAHIQNTTISRDGGRLTVEYPPAESLRAPAPPEGDAEPAAGADIPNAASTPQPGRPRDAARQPRSPRVPSQAREDTGPPEASEVPGEE